jgi:hypothetical protein
VKEPGVDRLVNRDIGKGLDPDADLELPPSNIDGPLEAFPSLALDAEPVEVELAVFGEPIGEHRPRHRCRVRQPEVFGNVDGDAEGEVWRLYRHQGVDLKDPEGTKPQRAGAIRVRLFLHLVLRMDQRNRYDTTQNTGRQHPYRFFHVPSPSLKTS